MVVVVAVVLVVAVVAMGRTFEEEAFGRQSVGQGAESHSTGTQAESIGASGLRGFGASGKFEPSLFVISFADISPTVVVNFQT